LLQESPRKFQRRIRNLVWSTRYSLFGGGTFESVCRKLVCGITADKERDQTTIYNNWNIRTALLKAAHLKTGCSILYFSYFSRLNPLSPELNPICYLLALLGAHHFLHVSRIRVRLLTFRLLMSYIYGAPILDVSRSHTTTQHSR